MRVFDVIQTVENLDQAKNQLIWKEKIMIQINIANLPQRSVQIEEANY